MFLYIKTDYILEEVPRIYEHKDNNDIVKTMRTLSTCTKCVHIRKFPSGQFYTDSIPTVMTVQSDVRIESENCLLFAPLFVFTGEATKFIGSILTLMIIQIESVYTKKYKIISLESVKLIAPRHYRYIRELR